MKLRTQNFSVIVSDFLTLFFPNYCAVCNLTLSKSENLVCTHCQSSINKTYLHNDQPNALHRRFFEIPNLKYVMTFSWFQKGSVIQKLMYQLKYEGNESIGVLLGEWYGQELEKTQFHSEWDMIVPVPLHYKKLKKRGFNQSHRIAEGLQLQLHLPIKNIIEKKYNRKSQTKKHRIERFNNVSQAFRLKKETDLTGKHILLVDDVLTTGATIQECSLPLQKAGATISVLTIAAGRG